MTLSRYVIALAMTISSTSLHAQSLSAAATLAASSLYQEFKSHVRTTRTSITVYNYFHTPTRENITAEMVTRAEDTEAFRRQMLNSVDYTWSTLDIPTTNREYRGGDGQHSNSLPGFFAALDPVVSVAFGGSTSAWALFEITLPSAFRYLELGLGIPNTDRAGDVAISSETLLLLARADCTVEHSTIFALAPTGACTEIWKTVVAKLDLDAILYPFDSAMIHACPDMPASALFFVGRRALRQAQILSLNAESVDNPKVHAHLSRHLGLQNIADLNEEKSRRLQTHRWPQIQPDSTDASQRWAQAHLLGCAPTHEGSVDSTTFKSFP